MFVKNLKFELKNILYSELKNSHPKLNKKKNYQLSVSESPDLEFNEFEPRLKSAKTGFN